MVQTSIYDIDTPCAVWDFRANESSYSSAELKDICSKMGKRWCFQLESGGITGYRHYQGRISLWKKKRGGELAKLWTNCGELPNYFQPTTKDVQVQGTFFYQMKEDTRVDGPWTNKDFTPFIPKQFKIATLKHWQDQIKISAGIFDSRKIDVIVDAVGNRGKSVCSGHLHLEGTGLRVPPINEPQALIQALMNMCMTRDNHSPGLIFIDLPRSQNKEKLAGLYNAIEQIKDGYLYDFRYQFKEWWIDSPRIWVFTNKMPDTKWLSADRWRFWLINACDRLEPIAIGSQA